MSEARSSKRDRSPAFPQVPLGEAVEKLGAFEQYFGRHPAPLDRAGAAWNLKQSGDILAALRYFGFIEYVGGSDAREVVITEAGRNLLRAQQPSVRQEILRKAALRPREIAKFWSKWGADRPPDPVCLDDLVLRSGFSQRGAPLFLRSYDETIAFAGLDETDKIAPDSAEIGKDDVDVDDPPPTQTPPKPPLPLVGVGTIMEGERELTTGLLSKNSSFRVIVSGPVGVKEIERLIRKLEFDKEILAEEASKEDISSQELS